jgi:hypothetical protein
MPVLYDGTNQSEFFEQFNIPNILVVDIRFNKSEYDWIFEIPNCKTMLYITEPIHYFGFVGGASEYSYKAFNENKFTYIFGCINHDPQNGRYKYPLYMFISSFEFKNKEYYNKINVMVQNTSLSQLNSKKFNALIASWDLGTRTNIYEVLRELGHIACPGKLHNNCSNEELDRIGKINYLQNYKFHICSENTDYDNVPGYITEKLMDCCLSGAIPIYAGWFDEYDEKIMNKNRIIFYKSNDAKSIEYAYYKVKFLMENPEMLLHFYNQPVFCETAYETVQTLRTDFENLIIRSNTTE